MSKLGTESYKGVRDFYPPDQFIQRYIFETMSRACEVFGYEEYSASILERAELYQSKTSEEIVNEQTYTFTDRGGREVTLRPEMTPTAARMVAAKRRDLAFPLRWYTIANMFRYERPQRGRLREHWQLNADIFGASGIEAEVEIISLAHRIMTELGAQESDFEIRISDRSILNSIYETLGLDEETQGAVTRLLDKREKIDDFEAQLAAQLNDKAPTLLHELEEASSNAHLQQLMGMLSTLGITNASIDTSIVRGFDYYTGMVFEVFDTSSENNRSLFGGGRYDNLLSMFDSEPIPAVGFGMGDVTARDFLETHNLLPAYTPTTELLLCPLENDALLPAMQMARTLRGDDITVAVNYSLKRPADQIRTAEKLGIRFIIFVGAKEMSSSEYTLKELRSGTETTLKAEEIADHIFSSAN